jgi:endoglucanase
MLRFTRLTWVLVLRALAAAWLSCAAAPTPAAEPASAADYNKLLGRGVNLGNALEAPTEGAWGFRLKAEYFAEIKRAGFQSVRLPVRWSAHALAEPPYTIDATFLKRVDWAIDEALKNKLTIVLNVHHYDEIFDAPDKHSARLKGLWKQIAAHYRDRSDRLFFELLNEPHGKLTAEAWQRMFPEVLAEVRATNPKRMAIVGPGDWNGIGGLYKLSLPASDRNLIVTFHYYSPFEFTHQSASWVPNSDRWKGTTWTGTDKQTSALARDFDRVSAWSRKHDRPVLLGEFGAYSGADMDSRARWTRAVTREAEKRGFSWAYWEFGSGFGVYDPAKSTWRAPLKNALLDQPEK